MKRILFVTVLALMLLAGCGGGGGSDNFRGLLQGTWQNIDGGQAIECFSHPGKFHKWEMKLKFNKLNELTYALVIHDDGNAQSEACLTAIFRDRTWEGKGLELKLKMLPVPGYNLHGMTKLEVNTDNDDTQGLVLTINPGGGGIGDIIEADLIGVEWGDTEDFGPNHNQGTTTHLKLKRVAL